MELILAELKKISEKRLKKEMDSQHGAGFNDNYSELTEIYGANGEQGQYSPNMNENFDNFANTDSSTINTNADHSIANDQTSGSHAANSL